MPLIAERSGAELGYAVSRELDTKGNVSRSSDAAASLSAVGMLIAEEPSHYAGKPCGVAAPPSLFTSGRMPLIAEPCTRSQFINF
jgi:hypothetical protein